MSWLTPLLKKQLVAPNTLLLSFEKPPGYVFEAGQYAYIRLLSQRYPDYDHHQRILSFASAPHEAQLDFVVRLRESGYKKELAELTAGDRVTLTSAIGSFGFPNSDRPIIAIAGGIGVAPFLSLIKDRINANRFQPLFLIWTNQTKDSIPLLQETQKLVAEWPGAKLVLVLTRQPNPQKPGSSPRISFDWLATHQFISQNAYYLLCGPIGLVTELSDGLLAHRIPGQNIRLEAFTGY